MAGIIRREDANSTALAYSFEDLEARARAMLARAQEQSRRLVADAQAQADQIRDAAREDGHAKGLEEGRMTGARQAHDEALPQALGAAKNQLTQLTSALAAGLREFDAAKRTLLAHAEASLLDLALSIAKRVCKQAALANPIVAVGNLREVLTLARHERDIAVHVNPAQHALLQQAAPKILEDLRRLDHVNVVADEAVTAGGCVLHSSTGTIDAQIEPQLERIAAALRPHDDGADDDAPGAAESAT